MDLRKMFQNRELSSCTDPSVVEDICSRLNGLERAINKLSLAVFQDFHGAILEKSAVYIVPAVWGEKPGDLDETQKEIHDRLKPLLDEFMDLFGGASFIKEDLFLSRYFIRSLFVYKILYMAELYRNLIEKTGTDQPVCGAIGDMETVGSA